MVETILARTPLCIVAPVGWPAIVGYRQRLAAVYAALRDGILGALDAASPCEGVCFFGEERTLKPVMEVGHWQLSGVAFSVASAGTACLIRPELPSLVASAIGGDVVVGLLKTGHRQSKDDWELPEPGSEGPSATPSQSIISLGH